MRGREAQPPSGQRPGGAPARPARARYAQPPILVSRLRIAIALICVIAVALMVRLAWVQVVWGERFSSQAIAQRSRVYVEPARRGDIVDRTGQRLAYTMQARSLTVSPTRLRMELAEQERLRLSQAGQFAGADSQRQDELVAAAVDDRLRRMAVQIPSQLSERGIDIGNVTAEDIATKLQADTFYEVLVRDVDPDVAVAVAREHHGIAADHQDIRHYPNGAIAENVIGKVSMDGQGQFGFEAAGDALLSGIDGRSTEDVSTDGQTIPGTLRDDIAAVDGKTVRLTLDLDLQTFVQQKLESAVRNSQALSGEAVVLDAASGEILAMANTGSIDPNKDIEAQLQAGKHFDNRPVSYPFEPGSVAKVITAAAAIEEGITDPGAVHQVPGSIDMAGVRVRDAWAHDTEPYTTTGIFSKSSNVGTLMLAEQLGQERFAQYLQDFGLGAISSVELPNESAGLLPALQQWSGGTFANLPIGQGMSWTALQMASVYQTLANGGERIEPRIIAEITGSDGVAEQLPQPGRTQVVSAETAATVVSMFRGTFQSDPTGVNAGTAGGNAIPGYQLAGKTGTAQKVDPNTGAYSNSAYWITFAGIAPADDPRFVVAIMLDEPASGVNDDGSGGQSAAPVFRDIAQWLIDRDNIAPTHDPEFLVLRP